MAYKWNSSRYEYINLKEKNLLIGHQFNKFAISRANIFHYSYTIYGICKSISYIDRLANAGKCMISTLFP